MQFGPGLSQLVEPKRMKNKNYLISDTIVLDQGAVSSAGAASLYLEVGRQAATRPV